MSVDLSPDRVADTYRDGVDSLVGAARRVDDDQRWDQLACGTWTAVQVVHHVTTVASWYHEWLDRAIAGSSTPPFPEAELDARNDAALRRAHGTEGTDATSAFQTTATSYCDRALDHWAAAYGYPFGTVTVGAHLGVAAAEWHLHAWDLDADHTPRDAEGLFIAAGTCVAATKPQPLRWAMRQLVPLGARRRPWASIVHRSGR